MHSSSSVSVYSVVRLACPSRTTVVGGRSGLYRPVVWARAIGARPVALATIEPGEMVLVNASASPISGEASALERLLRDLTAAGISSLAVLGEIPAAMRSTADELAVPLLRLPARTSLLDLERTIQTFVADPESVARGRLEEVSDKLMAALVDDTGLGPLVELLAQCTNKVVAVIDEFGELSAQALPAQWEQNIPAPTPELVQACSEADDHGGVVPLSDHHPLAFLRQTLRIGRSPAGSLVVIGPESEFLPFDIAVVGRASTVLSVELAKQRAILEAQYRLQGDFADDLLEGRAGPEDAALARGRHLGYDLTQPHIALVFRPDLPEEDEQVRSSKAVKRFLEAARTEVLRESPAAILRERNGRLSVLFPFSRPPTTEEALLVADRLRRRVAAAWGGGPGVTVGIGRFYDSLQGLPTAHREAEQALTIGQRVMGGNTCVHFAQLGVYRVLFHLLGNQEVLDYQREVLGPLLEHDRRYGGDLVKTLEAFFACNGNHVRTAQLLHLHRNTLLYRLEKVEQLLGVDLADPETRLALQLALKMTKMAPKE